mmetsp:Transcript_27757/g.38772  ORF Transcript_27757/g.38772 Transcript_27757/m.38772 type:complete len:371 (-) Transcript_27757:25-1137(-)
MLTASSQPTDWQDWGVWGRGEPDGSLHGCGTMRSELSLRGSGGVIAIDRALQVAIQQVCGRWIEPIHRSSVRPRPDQLLSHSQPEALAKLDAILIERVDAPHEALHGYSVLVERQELAYGVRVKRPVDKDHRGGPVPRHHLVRHELLPDPGLAKLLRVLADGEGVGLREEVGHELVVVGHRLALEVDGALAAREAEEVDGHHAPLVEHLEERVLGVRARLAELYLGRGVAERLAPDRHRLAVALHPHLLHVGGELGQRVRVGDDRARGEALEVGLPDVDEPHHRREVAGERRLDEVPVHGARPREEVAHGFHPVVQGEGENPHRGADGVAPADPIPEGEDVSRVHAELRGLFDVRTHRDHVPLHDLTLKL